MRYIYLTILSTYIYIYNSPYCAKSTTEHNTEFYLQTQTNWMIEFRKEYFNGRHRIYFFNTICYCILKVFLSSREYNKNKGLLFCCCYLLSFVYFILLSFYFIFIFLFVILLFFVFCCYLLFFVCYFVNFCFCILFFCCYLYIVFFFAFCFVVICILYFVVIWFLYFSCYLYFVNNKLIHQSLLIIVFKGIF